MHDSRGPARPVQLYFGLRRQNSANFRPGTPARRPATAPGTSKAARSSPKPGPCAASGAAHTREAAIGPEHGPRRGAGEPKSVSCRRLHLPAWSLPAGAARETNRESHRQNAPAIAPGSLPDSGAASARILNFRGHPPRHDGPRARLSMDDGLVARRQNHCPRLPLTRRLPPHDLECSTCHSRRPEMPNTGCPAPRFASRPLTCDLHVRRDLDRRPSQNHGQPYRRYPPATPGHSPTNTGSDPAAGTDTHDQATQIFTFCDISRLRQVRQRLVPALPRPQIALPPFAGRCQDAARGLPRPA